ncbi:TIM-barrel domain-containing protein [Sphingomonas sp. ASV193]|uniref:glycoside hydrolase family 31 protein n=1 Tax=Sphingomonas sp. ASV193 TaxID=3144405 RepID=UPI0032E8AAD3
MGRLRAAALLATSLWAGTALAATTPAGRGWHRIAHGIELTPADRPGVVRLLAYGDGIIRVSEGPGAALDLPRSLMVTAVPAGEPQVREEAGSVTVSTARLSAIVDRKTGTVRFVDDKGAALVGEDGPPSFAPVAVDGKPFLAIRQSFNRGSDEGLFGFGQHQSGKTNLAGEDVTLQQHNMDVALPFLLSTRHYGILWDNDSATRLGDPRPYPLAGAPGDGLGVTGADGSPGWTATYRVGDRIIATRREPTIDLRYLENVKDWPAGTRTADGGDTVPGLTVEWVGTVRAAPGLHRFRMYSSGEARLTIDGKPLLERWRQNWNPWFHNADVELGEGPHQLRLSWEPQGGYIGLYHADPRPAAARSGVTLSSEVARGVDYYVVAGATPDAIIGGYRALTGKAPIMPKWAYGFWQSRQRYETQDQLLGVLREYRRLDLPLDNIVQDWRYWADPNWGCHCFDATRFPDPRAMVDEIHASGAHAMISVWAKFYPTTAHYQELAKVGGMLTNMVTPRPDEPTDPDYIHRMYRDWVGPGFANAFYDPFNPAARDLYSRQLIESLGTKGFDAWWLDSDEPDFQSNISTAEWLRRMGPTALGPAAAHANAYPLAHVENVYDHLIVAKPDVRPFILTRSGFAGIQRAGSAIWSGDVVSRWDSLREQVAAGIGLSLSGMPNWSHDIGGYAMEARFIKPTAADLDEWRELNTRWFQFGAFSPIFRSHGQDIPREIYLMSPPGSPTYRSMSWYDRLRYRLLPYIYTLGADTYASDGTIMRGLVMDFPGDRRGWDVADEYMFGPAFLVAPVSEYRARQRSVWLPAGADWYDLSTGKKIAGGQAIVADAPYERMPLFVRAGSIVPTGPAIQHSGEDSGKPLTLFVYAGADGRFTLYEDDGVSRQYLNGAAARTPFRWDDKRRTLTIGARQGRFAGMAGRRTIRVRWIRADRPRPFDLDAPADSTLVYDGRERTVRMP